MQIWKFGYNRSGLLNDVLQTVNALTKNLNSVEARTNKDKMATIHLTVGIQNLSHLKVSWIKSKQYLMSTVYAGRMDRRTDMRAVVQRVVKLLCQSISKKLEKLATAYLFY